jgi:hypothetical protein
MLRTNVPPRLMELRRREAYLTKWVYPFGSIQYQRGSLQWRAERIEVPSQHRRKRRLWQGSGPARTSASKKRRATKATASRKKTSEPVLRTSRGRHDCTLSCRANVFYVVWIPRGTVACRHERAKFALSTPALSGGPWQLLLGVEDVEGRALADRRFLTHAAEGHLGRLDLRLRGQNLRP